MAQARMQNPVVMVPEAMKAALALGNAARVGDVPAKTRLLVLLRASQINGCSVCVDMHAQELKKMGESDQRLFAVAAWYDTPFFNDAERAALSLTEAATRAADRSDAVPDALWEEVARHYDEPSRAGLVMNIALINFWNRINLITRQVAGAWQK